MNSGLSFHEPENLTSSTRTRETRCVCFILLGHTLRIRHRLCVCRPEERESEMGKWWKSLNMRRLYTYLCMYFIYVCMYKLRCVSLSLFPAPFQRFPHCGHFKFISCVQLPIVCLHSYAVRKIWLHFSFILNVLRDVPDIAHLPFMLPTNIAQHCCWK